MIEEVWLGAELGIDTSRVPMQDGSTQPGRSLMVMDAESGRKVRIVMSEDEARSIGMVLTGEVRPEQGDRPSAIQPVKGIPDGALRRGSIPGASMPGTPRR